ncbi:hypothetical protein [Xanthomonas phaseoli]|uniref:hypothetical protein n=1 Tax=Xanthomonas phaseoli TaxID=1985254 RepID=UPI001ADBBC43|nr:hypothetical protein [Xanthomonas phaseoli]MBO9854671.1 hypothetical protein [Xanthomonas phaseoli pv. dieffenbachiae]MBO9968381.1 hypothetical protein [Xanthomonas phaseoli pv. dieffenbachiae]MBO9987330.1 hypothetical protein [Xanthomonas phaseoli pv. dieffenbachiae]
MPGDVSKARRSFDASVVRVIALRLLPGSHVQEHKSTRAQEHKSARAQERKRAKEQKSKSAEMLKCKKVSDTKFLKTNWRQSEGGADAHNAAASAARTVIDARMHLAKISVEAIRHVVRSHPVSALML